MSAGNLFENVPHFRGLPFNHLFSGTNGMNITEFLQASDNEWFEQDQRHLLGQTALMELQLGADDDDRAARIIDTLAKQVLAETPTLALEHIAEGFEGAIARASHSATVTSIIEQGINGFLKHSLLIADDDLGRFELEQVFQPIIAVDDTPVEVV